nr:hypothetical protein [Tanacetum cinerariifolium]
PRLPGSRQHELRGTAVGSGLCRECRSDPPAEPDRQPDERDALLADRQPGRQRAL